ncbi:hypothetical protein FOWG_18070 [Fusarium oxysporum f. sp. lycopersici MN25]|nr:hypothetical protein FOWG_18070 [Fusarium oxysporum f. sp. lycopersici MN25]
MKTSTLKTQPIKMNSELPWITLPIIFLIISFYHSKHQPKKHHSLHLHLIQPLRVRNAKDISLQGLQSESPI